MDRAAHLTVTVAFIVALTGCGKEGGYSSTEDMVDDLSGAAAEEAVSPVRSEVEALERRVGELEAEVQRLSASDQVDTANISKLFSHDGWQDKAIERLYENDRQIAGRVGMPFQESP